MWKVTSNEQKVTINKQKVTSNEQNVTSNEQKVMSKEQQAKLSASVILDFGNWMWYYLRNYFITQGTWYFLRLCFSFSSSDYELILIKKSHKLSCYSFLRKFLLKTKTCKLVVGNYTPCPSASVRCTPVASPVDKFPDIAIPVPNYASSANKWISFLHWL